MRNGLRIAKCTVNTGTIASVERTVYEVYHNDGRYPERFKTRSAALNYIRSELGQHVAEHAVVRGPNGSCNAEHYKRGGAPRVPLIRTPTFKQGFTFDKPALEAHQRTRAGASFTELVRSSVGQKDAARAESLLARARTLNEQATQAAQMASNQDMTDPFIGARARSRVMHGILSAADIKQGVSV